MGLICFNCKQEIYEGVPKFMLGVEKPYVNLWFHRACYDMVKEWIDVYLQENVERVYNYAREVEKNNKK